MVREPAFLVGVVPLVFSTGGGAESRHSIGTGVFGGMTVATILGLIFTPVSFYVCARGLRRRRRAEGKTAWNRRTLEAALDRVVTAEAKQGD
ncbi:efflux RND transporter permease subunit [Paraburkholderia sp. EG304]|uniref:efflux RND transporter permease subunit n=1 Tax=Paraburkholderia sp. EG304 TaxID=3237015 RepID=UPI00397DE437